MLDEMPALPGFCNVTINTLAQGIICLAHVIWTRFHVHTNYARSMCAGEIR